MFCLSAAASIDSSAENGVGSGNNTPWRAVASLSIKQCSNLAFIHNGRAKLYRAIRRAQIARRGAATGDTTQGRTSAGSKANPEQHLHAHQLPVLRFQIQSGVQASITQLDIGSGD